jgi:hypothetical protein
MTKGDNTPQLDFFLNVLKILITLSVILRHLEAELTILRCLKLIRGLFPFTVKNNKLKTIVYPPQIYFWRKPCGHHRPTRQFGGHRWRFWKPQDVSIPNFQ